MDTFAPLPDPVLRDILEVIAASEADIAAGRLHDLEDVLRDLDNDIAEMLAKDAATEHSAVRS